MMSGTKRSKASTAWKVSRLSSVPKPTFAGPPEAVAALGSERTAIPNTHLPTVLPANDHSSNANTSAHQSAKSGALPTNHRSERRRAGRYAGPMDEAPREFG